MRWPRMLLLVAVAATFAFAGKLWASALQPRSIVLPPPLPLRPTQPPPHLTAPRIVVPASPSVAAHLGLNGGPAKGPGPAGRGSGDSSTTPPPQAAGAPPVQPDGASGDASQAVPANGQGHSDGNHPRRGARGRGPRNPPAPGPPQ